MVAIAAQQPYYRPRAGLVTHCSRVLGLSACCIVAEIRWCQALRHPRTLNLNLTSRLVLIIFHVHDVAIAWFRWHCVDEMSWTITD
jgi:hypothetical protein